MIPAACLGLVVGLAAAAALGALAPLPAPLGRALSDLHRPVQDAEVSSDAPVLGVRLARLLGVPRRLGPTLRSDLAVAGHDETWFAAWGCLLGLVGLATGPVLGLLALLAGTGLPWLIPVGASLLAGPGALGAHLLSVRTEAARRRGEFAFALSAYLDLVVVSMAAGRGVEGALTVAAESGSGWAFEAMRARLDSARLRGVTPWSALDELGAAWEVPELRGLASSIELAGASGAKVRSSVAARARALRLRGVANARSAAESATERMSLPVVLLVVGFLVLIGYPAIVEITTRI